MAAGAEPLAAGGDPVRDLIRRLGSAVRRRGRSGRVWWTAAVAGSMGLAWSVLHVTAAGTNVLSVLPFVVTGVTIVATIVVEQRARDLELLSPLAFGAFAYLIMFAIVPILDLAFQHPLVHREVWWLASWLAWAAYVAMYAGYRLAIAVSAPRPERPSAWRWDAQRGILIAGVLLLVAFSAVLGDIREVGGLSYYLSRFARRFDLLEDPIPTLLRISLAVPAILLVAGWWVQRPTPRRAAVLFLMWLPPVLAVSAYRGHRWRALAVLIALLAIRHLGVKRIRAAGLVAISAILIVAFVAVNLTRFVVGTGQKAQSISGATAFYNNYVGRHEIGEFREFVITLEGVPRVIPFLYGETFLSVIPGTPFRALGEVYTTTFLPEIWERGSNVSNSLPGELYMNFGYIGIFAGMALFGAALGWLESWHRRNRERIGALLVYAYALLPVAGVLRGEFTTFVGFPMISILFLLGALVFVERRVPEGTQALAEPASARLVPADR